MSEVKVEFLFDFGSPNAYFCHKVIPEIEKRTGVKFKYVPILLGGLFKLTNNRSPVEAFAAIKNKRAYDRLEIERFIKKHGLSKFQMNPNFPVNTLQIMRGAIAAQKLNCFEKYIEAVYAAMWEQGLKMDEKEVIFKALSDAGLDAQSIMEKSQDEVVKKELVANTEESERMGAFGSPTFFVNGEIYFGKDRLREIEDEIEKLRV